MKILAIGGSNSKSSINRKLAYYASSLFNSNEVEFVDVSQLELPLYSLDVEAENGVHEIAIEFAKKIDLADLLIISLAENNGSYNVGYKNLIDWTSRIKSRKTFGEKSMLLMATSPGPRGGATVLETAKNYYPQMGAIIKETFSLPDFYKNFNDEKGIINPELEQQLNNIINNLKNN